MTDARRLVEEIGRELGPTEQEIRHHPYVTALEAGRVRREELPRFAGEQYHIIRSDLRSVAQLLNRFGTTPSGPIEEAGKIKNTDIMAELKLPPVKTHCSVLAEDAIKAALAAFRERYGTVGAAATVKRSRRARARAGFRTATANLRRLRSSGGVHYGVRDRGALHQREGQGLR